MYADNMDFRGGSFWGRERTADGRQPSNRHIAQAEAAGGEGEGDGQEAAAKARAVGGRRRRRRGQGGEAGGADLGSFRAGVLRDLRAAPDGCAG